MAVASQQIIDQCESLFREDTGIAWDWRLSMPKRAATAAPQTSRNRRGTQAGIVASAKQATTAAAAPQSRPKTTNGATYTYDGSFEGMLAAIHQAMLARDTTADILPDACLQPRLDQEVVNVAPNMQKALMVRRCVEHAQGTRAFECLRAASASDDPAKGTIAYRFIQHALCASTQPSCSSCPRKRECTCACSTPSSSPLLDDVSSSAVFDLMRLYRQVMNERHYMLQFIRFQHCEGDVWVARCNPKASVVPLLMDWFVPRFNDQRFAIYDENHGVTGIYDGTRWYLVGGDVAPTLQHSPDEAQMQEAWQCFYRNASIDERYHPELRRGFMPMRLWRNLPELQAQLRQAPLRDSIPV